MLSRQSWRFQTVLETWGILSMDIYILSDIIKIPFRIVFWNKLHWYSGSFVICTIAAMVLSVWITNHLIRRFGWSRRLVLGMRK